MPGSKAYKLAIAFLAAQAVASGVDRTAAFEMLKSWQGAWEIRSNGKILPIQMTYDIGSNGSIVTERFGKELSVFYNDGPELAMIHFCNRANQPRLRLLDGRDQSKVLDFGAFQVTNLTTPDTPHVEQIVYKMVDQRTIELEIVWKRSSSRDSEKYVLNKR